MSILQINSDSAEKTQSAALQKSWKPEAESLKLKV